MNKRYTIRLSKKETDIIFEGLFNPKIIRFAKITCVGAFLNYPDNWTMWQLPQELHNKDLEILNFDKNKIVIYSQN